MTNTRTNTYENEKRNNNYTEQENNINSNIIENVLENYTLFYIYFLREFYIWLIGNEENTKTRIDSLLKSNQPSIDVLDNILKYEKNISNTKKNILNITIDSIKKNIIDLNHISNELFLNMSRNMSRDELLYAFKNNIFKKKFSKYVFNNNINNIDTDILNSIIDNFSSQTNIDSFYELHNLEKIFNKNIDPKTQMTFYNIFYLHNYGIYLYLAQNIYIGSLLNILLSNKDITNFIFEYEKFDKNTFNKEFIKKINYTTLILLIETKQIYNKKITQNEQFNHSKYKHLIREDLLKNLMSHNDLFNTLFDISIKALEITQWFFISNIEPVDLNIFYNFGKQKNDMETLLFLIKKITFIIQSEFINNKLYKCEELIKEFSELIKENYSIIIFMEDKEILDEKEKSILQSIILKREKIVYSFVDLFFSVIEVINKIKERKNVK